MRTDVNIFSLQGTPITASLTGAAVSADAGTGTVSTPSGTALFSDGFESGDLSYASPGGGGWAATNNTGVLLSESAPGLSGSYALAFDYAAGAYWAEQRFTIGAVRQELWFSFWLKVPSNFSYGPSGSPNKLWSIWQYDPTTLPEGDNGYSASGDGSTCFCSFHPSGDGACTFAVTQTTGGYTTSEAFGPAVAFMSPSDAGRWQQFKVQLVCESSPGAADGYIKQWRRWENEAVFTLTHHNQNKSIKVGTASGGSQGFDRGYLMGWANAAYAADTQFLVDGVVFADSESALDANISWATQ